MYGYIYLIVNNISGKTYIGKRKLYNKKWNEDGYMGSGCHLKNSQAKYGIENFEKFLITWTYSEEDACEKEKFWIAEYRKRGKAEYNVADGGQGGFIGTMTEERRKKISEAGKGRKAWNKGKHFSEEYCRKLSDVHKGKPSYNKGKHFSEEYCRKLSEVHKGKKRSEEDKRKISESLKGHKAWNKGRKWYTNGTESVQAFECPDGFVPGRCRK